MLCARPVGPLLPLAVKPRLARLDQDGEPESCDLVPSLVPAQPAARRQAARRTAASAGPGPRAAARLAARSLPAAAVRPRSTTGPAPGKHAASGPPGRTIPAVPGHVDAELGHNGRVGIRAGLSRLDERFLGPARPLDLREPNQRRRVMVFVVVLWAAEAVMLAGVVLGADSRHHFLLISCVAFPLTAGQWTRRLWMTRRPA